MENAPAAPGARIVRTSVDWSGAGLTLSDYLTGRFTYRDRAAWEERIASGEITLNDRIVPPEVFLPPPEVESAVAVFARRDPAPDAAARKHLAGVAKTAFAQRRKQMGKVLGANYGREKVLAAFAELGLSPEIRPDRVSPEIFEQLTGKLFA